MAKKVKLLITDRHDRIAICAEVRTSTRELERFEDALAGNRPLAAQLRLAIELAKRGVDVLGPLTNGAGA